MIFIAAPFVLLLAKIQFDCASGINACNLSLPASSNLMKSAPDQDLTQFETALNFAETLDVNQVYANREIAGYFDQNNEKTQPLDIYPNPARDVLWVDIPSESRESSSLSLFDMQGKEVYNEIIDNNAVQINVKHLRNGVYKVVLNGDISKTASVIVQH